MSIIVQRKKNKGPVHDKTKDWFFLLSLVVLAMAAFLLIGSDSYVLFSDSGSYMNMERYMEGVMPVYPLFLRLNRVLFGETLYLQAVTVEQAVFAGICLTVFTNLLRRQFALNVWESYVIFLLSLLPFTTDLPEAMTTQEILTEGIAYAAFYLFMAVLLKTAWTKQYRYVPCLFLMTWFLAATRSQLQILFGVCGIVFFYVVLMRKERARKSSTVVRLVFALAGCICISIAGIWCTGRTSVAYQKMLGWHIQNLKRAEALAQQDKTGEEETVDNTAETETETGEEEEPEQKVIAAQYTSLIFSRGMYEADYEDYQLFEDEQIRKLYLHLYETASQNECLYTYAEPGLWMWKDIVGGIGSVGNKCLYALAEYYNAMPQIAQRSDYNIIKNESAKLIGITLLKEHWTRFLYHTVMMLPQAFICTVFFQIGRIYLLCHIITLFLYLTAAALMIWAYADRRIDRAYGEFMAAVLGTNLITILVISLVFFGQQRYLVYNFGIFYMIYFLLLLQLWKIYGKNWLMKWIKRRKS